VKIVAIGEEERLAGYALTGVTVLPAADAESARAAWTELPSGTALVLLTPSAATALAGRARERQLLWAVLPE
jgi:vacuolar-type H+-ATPase subunit F/Vma7